LMSDSKSKANPSVNHDTKPTLGRMNKGFLGGEIFMKDRVRAWLKEEGKGMGRVVVVVVAKPVTSGIATGGTA